MGVAIVDVAVVGVAVVGVAVVGVAVVGSKKAFIIGILSRLTESPPFGRVPSLSIESALNVSS